MSNVPTRHRLLPGREGAAVRDLGKFASAQVPLQLIEITATYAEPMTLRLDHAPKGLLLIRLRETDLPEVPIDALAAVGWTAVAGGARIDMIFGLEVGVQYQMTFLSVG